MTALLEFRERIKQIYNKIESFLIPLVKFLLAFLALNMVNSKLGYMSRIDNLAIVLMVALACSFLPNICIILFAVLFSVLHLYALSIEAAGVGLCLYLILFLLFFRFSPKSSLVIVLTPMLFAMNLPYVIPIAVGLICTPAAAVSVISGIVIYFFLEVVTLNATALATTASEEVIAKLRLLIDGLLDNRTMIVVIVAFTVTIITVYLIRRMSIDYSWTIAMIAGSVLNLMILLVGDFLYHTNLSVVMALLGSLLAVAVAKVLEFFRFCIDYNRVEKVQFEDDEYYYYVKAIPKMTVVAQTKTVKKINTQRTPDLYSQSMRTRPVEPARRVVTENVGRRDSTRVIPANTRNQTMINVAGDITEEIDDYEDLS
ncbi:MAG: hypothetical protein LBM69_00330 [Lachnospiraceae bacterium]|jgi:hypothetical protein|nr:hypothetical protein [Lachnospiraceae bacterium]